MKYFVFDNEGGNFCEWGRDEPRTRAEIIDYFRELNQDESCEPYPLKLYSLKMIMDIWNVDIIPIKP